VRLHAPPLMPDSPIVFPAGGRVLWHRVDTVASRQYRWTGSYRRLHWQATWPPVACIRVHLPLVREAGPNFAVGCTLALDGAEQPVRLVRGDITAEFDVAGKTRGTIQLTTPEPIHKPAEAGRAVGVAIATAQDLVAQPVADSVPA
jgi:hypothetical protein